jgi:uncharacterized membrane protein YuzA (DUF378 family)
VIKYIKSRLKQEREFYELIVRNNTGVSSKNYALVTGVQIAKFWTLVYLPAMLFIDQIFGKSITVNLYTVAALIGAIEAILAILILFKVKSEKYEYENKDQEDPPTEPGVG